MLVTVDTYQDVTGDTTSEPTSVESWIERATARLEEALERKLESAVRTERMHPTRDGSLWPHAIPVTVVPAGMHIDGNRIWGYASVTPFVTSAELTYTGGWVERSANPTAPNRLPVCIEEDIAIAAFLIGHPTPLVADTGVPVGATSVRLGDAAVTYGPNGAPVQRPTRIQWTSKTLGYRYVRIGGDPC